ncbi:MAG: SGNH/GDSL hydrolase family protein [Lentisphaerae bacterium]|nr:SGNH/GDSL hydrolase family protein [Lentisphaerota bacterium]
MNDTVSRVSAAGACLLGMLAAARAGEGPKPVRALFIGNSHTSYNNLPHMIAELAKAGGRPLFAYAMETPGGCTFEKHWQDGKAAERIAAGGWDFVVLQEQSLMPLTNATSMAVYAEKLDGEIKKQGARTLLYQTWARQNTPERQAELSRVYLDLGRKLEAAVAPVGMAWERALKANPNCGLHRPDKNHASKAGTYLAACVFYAVIYGVSPEGLPGGIADLDDGEARPLQAIAWQTVQQLARTQGVKTGQGSDGENAAASTTGDQKGDEGEQ